MSARPVLEQLLFARWVDLGTRAGLAFLVAAFLAYATGLLEPLVPFARLPELWSRPAAGGGWGWLAQLGHGEPLCLAAIALLALVPLAAMLRIAIEWWRGGARLHAALALAQVAVLLFAASGLVAGGHG